MAKIEIKNRWAGGLLFTHESADADADLRDADLSRANLSGADLSCADLSGTKWTDGVIINRAPLQIFGLRWDVTILDQYMQIGCQMHSLTAWSSFTGAEISAMDGRNALRFWRAHKDALNALATSDGRSTAEATQPKEI